MRVKVIHVVERIDDRYGGPARSIPYTAWSATTDHVEHLILSGSYAPSDINSVCEELGVNYRQFRINGSRKIAFSAGVTRSLIRHLRNDSNTIVHIHNSWNYVPFIVWLLSFVFKFSIIFSPRGALFKWSLNQGKYRKLLAWYFFQKSLLKKVDSIHVTSEQERLAVEKKCGCKNISLIPNGIFGTSAFDLSNAELRMASIEPLVLLFASRIHPKKGLDILLDSLANEHFAVPVVIWVAGDFSSDEYRNVILSKVESLGSNIDVQFFGHLRVEELNDLYRKAHLFVLPSHTENFGIAVAEALNAGLPVLTSVHTPWRELQDMGAGYFVELSICRIRESITDFCELDPQQRIQMSKAASHLAKRYDWRVLGDRYVDMYLKVVQG